MILAVPALAVCTPSLPELSPQPPVWGPSSTSAVDGGLRVWIAAAGEPDDEDEELGDEEDLAGAQPLADEESSFDDFDDEFDDDFEEEENDPDWDHPDDGDEEPPPGKGTGKKK
jgi:hypothetical protein